MTTRVILFLLLTLSIVNAEIRYASKTGSSIPPYTSWATAGDSIQKVIDVCFLGDTVYVGPGEYKEMVDMVRRLTLIGAGMDSTTINAGDFTGLRHAVKVRHNCLFEGFTVIGENNPNNPLGSGVYPIDDQITFSDGIIRYNKIIRCRSGIVTNNFYGEISDNIITDIYSRGIDLHAGSTSIKPLIKNNIIEATSYCIFINIGPSPKILNNIIFLTAGPGAFRGSYSDTVYIKNNIILSNNWIDNLAIDPSDSPLLLENNIIRNFRWGVMCQHKISVRNNIVQDCKYGFYYYNTGGEQIVKYNNVWNNESNYANFPSVDTTNLSLDPMFVSVDSGDYHLQRYSPMINAGDPGILDPDGSRSDIGPYGGPYGEIYSYIDYPPAIPDSIWWEINNSRITINWLKNHEIDFKEYHIKRYEGTPITETAAFATTDTTFSDEYTGSDYILYSLQTLDNQGNFSDTTRIEIILNKTGANFLIPEKDKLFFNYPNPFNPETKIKFYIKKRGKINLTIYDIKGEKVATLVDEYLEAGGYEKTFRPEVKENDLSSGIYVYKLERRENGKVEYLDFGKMVYLK